MQDKLMWDRLFDILPLDWASGDRAYLLQEAFAAHVSIISEVCCHALSVRVGLVCG